MSKFFNLLLIVHIIGGSTSLLLGSFILFSKKGDKKHKFLGNIFFYAMLTAALVSLPMAIIHPNPFLFVIGIFTFYMLMSGKRSLQKTKLENINQIDWAITLLMFLFGLAFICLGAYYLINGNNFGLVLLVFGIVGLLFVKIDYTNFKGNSKIKNFWLTTHIQRMIGAYIASVTAFLVVNGNILKFIPSIFLWLAPTILLVPFIVKWSRKNMILKEKI